MYQAPRGTADILPKDQPSWSFVLGQMQQAAGTFGYRRIDTPIFESTGLFQRTVGDGTDIVEKEMYSFRDRGDQELTLRPEGTASICRAYLEHGMHNQPLPVRLYYVEPMFRYDRPQAGRYRQFHQFGVEAIGDSDAAVDLEVLQLAMTAIEATGLGAMTLVLNNIGDAADRPAYLQELQAYYGPHLGNLCADCQRRYHRNPLRLLDCKQESCQSYLASAPHSADHLGAEAQAHWEELLGYLNGLGVPYQLDHRLVRGLDYYSRTVFEMMPRQGGSQSAICAGGRYDGLMEQLGGRPTPGIGFAIGLERVILNLRDQGTALPDEAEGPVVVAYRGATAKTASLWLADQLRRGGTAVVLAPERSLKAQLRYASGIAAARVLIIGDAELALGVVTLREMTQGTQRELPLDRVVAELNPH